jgi:hypothetical protein
MKGVAVVSDVFRDLVGKHSGLAIPSPSGTCSLIRRGVSTFHLILPLQELIKHKHSKDAFPSAYIEDCQNPSETFRCLVAGCGADKDADPLTAIFRGLVGFTVSSFERSLACGNQLGRGEGVMTAIHSAGYTTPDTLTLVVLLPCRLPVGIALSAMR